MHSFEQSLFGRSYNITWYHLSGRYRIISKSCIIIVVDTFKYNFVWVIFYSRKFCFRNVIEVIDKKWHPIEVSWNCGRIRHPNESIGFNRLYEKIIDTLRAIDSHVSRCQFDRANQFPFGNSRRGWYYSHNSWFSNCFKFRTSSYLKPERIFCDKYNSLTGDFKNYGTYYHLSSSEYMVHMTLL